MENEKKCNYIILATTTKIIVKEKEAKERERATKKIMKNQF